MYGISPNVGYNNNNNNIYFAKQNTLPID